MDVPLAISATLGSCCGCMIFVELLAKEDAGCMNLMTFSTFLFIALEGLIFGTKFFTVKNQIPLKAYIQVVILFFGVNVINNQALNFHIPVPLHIIFRSFSAGIVGGPAATCVICIGSLIANLLMGMWILNKRYSVVKYVSVVLITAGIIMCTLATSGLDKKKHSETVEEDASSFKVYVEYMIGLTMLWFALFFSALLGIRQEQLYTKYGKHNREALFYVHALSLPGFIFMASDIYKHVLVFNESEPVLGGIPKLWLYLLLNDVAQYMCISCVYKLTAECSSLTVTLVVTLRKFISLIVSIIYFGNPFTFQHWIGTVFVFGGTLLFSDIPAQVRAFREAKKKSD